MIDRDEDWGYFRRRAEEPTDPLILVAFYEGRGTDASGRSLEEILKWGELFLGVIWVDWELIVV